MSAISNGDRLASPKAPTAALSLNVPAELIDAIAERVVDRLGAGDPGADGASWLDVDEAAEYLRCKPQRIYDLVSTGDLRCAKEGRRSLFRPEWLDACVSVSAEGERR